MPRNFPKPSSSPGIAETASSARAVRSQTREYFSFSFLCRTSSKISASSPTLPRIAKNSTLACIDTPPGSGQIQASS